MSWFHDDGVLMDECPRETVAEGVVVARRSLLRFSAATVAAGLAAACATPSKQKVADAPAVTPAAAAPPRIDPLANPSTGTLDIAEFLLEMHPRAQAFVASGGKHEEAYLMAIGELMSRLEPPTPKETQAAMRDFQRNHAGGSRDLYVVMFDLKPGKGFSHHDHRDYNGMILGVEGEAHVTNYDILGDNPIPPQDETFQIRQTRDDLILPGRFSSLGMTRENVHELIAGPEGAVVLDVFTYLPTSTGSHFMEVAEEPRDAERRIYDASWV